MTIKYVKDFEFPAKAGYTKSAARKPAKMARGGRATDAELRAAQKAMGASGRVTDAELRALKRAMGASKPESITIREVTETIGSSDPSEGEREIPVIRRTDGERRRRPTDREQRERMGSSITREEIEAMAIAHALRDQEEQDYLQELLIEELIGDRIERVDFNDGGSALQNVRDEEGRVINIQDDAADELRRVEERRPHDAQEREDKSSQLARIGARERDAHEELHRDRDEAVMLGAKKGGSKKDWIQGAIKKPGALRKTLKVKKGESIPKGELRKAAKGEKIDGKKPSKKTQQRARLAETLGKMNTKKAAKGGSMRKQGYDDRLDESLGMSNGRNSQSMKARRDESKGMEKAMGKRAYSRVGTMDKAKGGRAKQGYDDKLDESLGSRDGKKSQSMKSRRDESKGMEKSMGRKAYSSVGTMDKGSKLAAVNRSTALKGFKQMGVMKRI